MNTAKTILEQLGGSKFVAMTGAKMLVDLGDGLMFAIGAGAKNRINKVRITLLPSDTYRVEFFKIRGVNVNKISEVEGVYNDNLQEVFTNHTGFYTSL